jgi:predicted enzyme related to lactoylglutathione lyase
MALASHGWADETHGPAGGFTHASAKDKPQAVEINIGVPDVDAGYAAALKAGFTAFKAPYMTHWGSRMAYVRDIDGHLVGLCGMHGGSSGSADAAPEAAAEATK